MAGAAGAVKTARAGDPNQRRDNALGFAKMPEGYELWQLDSGHWMWVESRTERESCIHWNKWAVYRGARLDAGVE